MPKPSRKPSGKQRSGKKGKALGKPKATGGKKPGRDVKAVAATATSAMATRSTAPQITLACVMTAAGPSWPEAPAGLVDLLENDGRFEEFLARGGIVVTMTEPEPQE
jgi:hypothetical protein